MENDLDQFKQVPDTFLNEIKPIETEFSEESFLKEISGEKEEPKKDDDILNFGENKEVPTSFAVNQISASNFLNEDLAVELYDSILVAIAIASLNVVGVEAKKSELQFSAKEKSTLKPIIKECLNDLKINFSTPWEALFWTSGIIIATKILAEKGDVIMDKFNGKKKVEAKKVVEKKDKPLSKYMQKKLAQNGKN